MWADVADQNRKCKRCVEGARVQRGCWTCIACKGVVPKEGFGRWLAQRTTKRPNGKQRRNKCFGHEERQKHEVAERTYRSVQS
eukprot:8562200-Pyramimonas_sp.AAC.1